MSQRQFHIPFLIAFVSGFLLAFQNCGGGGGGGGGGGSGSAGVETWKFVFTGTGANAHCLGGEFDENHTYEVITDKLLTASLNVGSSVTVRGAGEFSGTESVATQAPSPTVVCEIKPTTVNKVPAALEAYRTGFSSATPTLKMFIRADSSATLIGCKAFFPSLGYNRDIPADRLELDSTDYADHGVIRGTWRTVGAGGPGNGNDANGTFVATLQQSVPAPSPGPGPAPGPAPTPGPQPVQHRLTLINLTPGDASGTVAAAPSGVSCTASGNDATTCFAATGVVAPGTNLTVTATYDGAFNVVWGGDCSAAAVGTLSFPLTMDGDKDCTFAFANGTPISIPSAPADPILVYVTKIGTGQGTVTSTNMAGISCGADCNHTYNHGNGSASLTLTAAPNAGSSFVKWLGSCSGTNLTTSVAFNSSKKSCVAVFSSP